PRCASASSPDCSFYVGATEWLGGVYGDLDCIAISPWVRLGPLDLLEAHDSVALAGRVAALLDRPVERAGRPVLEVHEVALIRPVLEGPEELGAGHPVGQLSQCVDGVVGGADELDQGVGLLAIVV